MKCTKILRILSIVAAVYSFVMTIVTAILVKSLSAAVPGLGVIALVTMLFTLILSCITVGFFMELINNEEKQEKEMNELKKEIEELKKAVVKEEKDEE